MWLQAKIKAVIRLDKWSWPPVGHIKPKRHIFTHLFQKLTLIFNQACSKCSLSFVENFSRLQKQLHLKWKQFQNPLKFLKRKWFWPFSKPILTFKSFAKAIWKPTFFQKVLWTRLRKTKALFHHTFEKVCNHLIPGSKPGSVLF